MDIRIWESGLESARKGSAYCLCTVIESVGSTPRRAGASMLVRADGSTVGTVGGGKPERMVAEEAMAVMTEGKPRSRSFDLDDPDKHDTGSVCGGRMTVFFNPRPITAIVHLFGAGHVALPTARLLSTLGYAVKVYDESAEYANAERFPEAISFGIGNLAEQAAKTTLGETDSVVILTASHTTDFEVVRAFCGRLPKYIGVIGSKTKARHYRELLLAEGWPQTEIDKIHSPIGIEIGSRTPEEIAVSIVAEMIALRGQSE